MKRRFFGFKTTGKIIPIICSAVLLMAVFSCSQNTIEFPEEGYESFSASIQPIFNNNCTLCHSGNQSPNLSEGSSFLSLTTNGYVNTDDPASSLIYEKLQGGSHSTYTSSANKELILEWIQAGAPND